MVIVLNRVFIKIKRDGVYKTFSSIHRTHAHSKFCGQELSEIISVMYAFVKFKLKVNIL